MAAALLLVGAVVTAATGHLAGAVVLAACGVGLLATGWLLRG